MTEQSNIGALNRWAVVIGISKYEDESLNLGYADRDALAFYELICSPSGGDFNKDHIALLVNEDATTRNVRIALQSFLKRPAKEDLVIIYIACHGSPDPERPGNVYLLTHDVDKNNISGTGVPMYDIDSSLRRILHAEKVVIIADTCHSAAIGGGPGLRDVSFSADKVNNYLDGISRARGGTALITSCEANETAQEDVSWGGGHGVFTHFLLEGMRGAADYSRNGQVTLGDLFEYVRENVKEATGHRQHPSIGTTPFDRNLPMSVPGLEQAIEFHEQATTSFADGDLNQASRLWEEVLRISSTHAGAREGLDNIKQMNSERQREEAIRKSGEEWQAAKASAEAPERHPSIAIKLSVKPTTIVAGEEAKWTLTLRNNGDDDLNNMTVSHGSSLFDEPFNLAVGKGRRFTFTRSYPTEGTTAEKVTATGLASGGGGVSEEASAIVQVQKASPGSNPQPTNVLDAPKLELSRNSTYSERFLDGPTLNWTTSRGATGYLLQMSYTKSFKNPAHWDHGEVDFIVPALFNTLQGDTSFTLMSDYQFSIARSRGPTSQATQRKPGQNEYYRVKARSDNAPDSPWSNVVRFNPTVRRNLELDAPRLELSVTSVGARNLKWTPCPGATSYVLQLCDNKSFLSPAELYSGDKTKFSAPYPGLSPDDSSGTFLSRLGFGQTEYYRVKAKRRNAEGRWSNVIKVK